MPDPVDADSIAEAAASPASASVDGNSASAVPIPDQIQADRYRKASSAASGRNRGIVFSKLIPPGPASDGGTTGREG